jgi:hypothetical protein
VAELVEDGADVEKDGRIAAVEGGSEGGLKDGLEKEGGEKR